MVLSGQVSDCCDVLSAVTQGSVLRLALFALCMYISDSVNTKILTVEDDTKMYPHILLRRWDVIQYTLCSKTFTCVACYNLDVHEPILVITRGISKS